MVDPNPFQYVDVLKVLETAWDIYKSVQTGWGNRTSMTKELLKEFLETKAVGDYLVDTQYTGKPGESEQRERAAREGLKEWQLKHAEEWDKRTGVSLPKLVHLLRETEEQYLESPSEIRLKAEFGKGVGDLRELIIAQGRGHVADSIWVGLADDVEEPFASYIRRTSRYLERRQIVPAALVTREARQLLSHANYKPVRSDVSWRLDVLESQRAFYLAKREDAQFYADRARDGVHDHPLPLIWRDHLRLLWGERVEGLLPLAEDLWETHQGVATGTWLATLLVVSTELERAQQILDALPKGSERVDRVHHIINIVRGGRGAERSGFALMRLSPDDPDAAFNLASVLFRRAASEIDNRIHRRERRLRVAIALLGKAAKSYTAPQDHKMQTLSRIHSATCSRLLGHSDEAYADLKALEEDAQRHRDIYSQWKLAVAEASEAIGNMAEARAKYEEMLACPISQEPATEPGLGPLIHLAIARTCFNAHDFKNAGRYLVQVNPEGFSPAARENYFRLRLGLAAVAQDNVALGRMFEEMPEIYSRDAERALIRGWVHLLRDVWEDAVSELKKALPALKDNEDVWIYLLLASLKLHRNLEAYEFARRAQSELRIAGKNVPPPSIPPGNRGGCQDRAHGGDYRLGETGARLQRLHRCPKN